MDFVVDSGVDCEWSLCEICGGFWDGFCVDSGVHSVGGLVWSLDGLWG